MTTNPSIEKFVRANGKVYKRNNVEIIRMELDTEHYYYLGDVGWAPSVTSILSEAAPVDFGLRRFWQQNTAEEAGEIFRTAGDFGSKIHGAVEGLLLGQELNLLADYPSIREKKAVLRFADWFNILQPTDFMSEQVVASTQYLFAGTLDFLGRVKRANAANAMGLGKRAWDEFVDGEPEKEETWLIDFKTTKALHYSHELQVAAYKQAVIEGLDIKVDRMGLLRFPTQHKVGYEFKETRRTIDDYMHIYRTWLNLHNGIIPYPEELVSYPNKFRLLNNVKESK